MNYLTKGLLLSCKILALWCVWLLEHPKSQHCQNDHLRIQWKGCISWVSYHSQQFSIANTGMYLTPDIVEDNQSNHLHLLLIQHYHFHQGSPIGKRSSHILHSCSHPPILPILLLVFFSSYSNCCCLQNMQMHFVWHRWQQQKLRHQRQSWCQACPGCLVAVHCCCWKWSETWPPCTQQSPQQLDLYLFSPFPLSTWQSFAQVRFSHCPCESRSHRWWRQGKQPLRLGRWSASGWWSPAFFLRFDFIQLSYLILPPLRPGVVREIGSRGEEGKDDANPEGTITHAEITVKDVTNAMDGRVGSKLCWGLCNSIVPPAFSRHL